MDTNFSGLVENSAVILENTSVYQWIVVEVVLARVLQVS